MLYSRQSVYTIVKRNIEIIRTVCQECSFHLYQIVRDTIQFNHICIINYYSFRREFTYILTFYIFSIVLVVIIVTST